MIYPPLIGRRLVWFTLIILFLNVAAYGESCPYCGKTYGAGGSRDQAYLQRIRAEHEASCPARFQNNNPQNSVPPTQDDQATAAAVAAAEAARRAAEVEQQRAREREEAARKQAEFDEAKRDALSSMKGIADNEFVLKDLSTGDNVGLKSLDDTKMLFSKPTPSSAPVDGNAKDPSKLDDNIPTGLQKSAAGFPETLRSDSRKEFNDAFAALCKKYGIRMEQEQALEQDVPFFYVWEAKAASDPVFWRELESLRDKYARASVLTRIGLTDERRHDEILNDPVFIRESERLLREKDAALEEADRKVLEKYGGAAFAALCKKYEVMMEQERGFPLFFAWEVKEQSNPAFKEELQSLRANYRKDKDATEKEIRDRFFKAMLEQVEKCDQRLSEKERTAASQP